MLRQQAAWELQGLARRLYVYGSIQGVRSGTLQLRSPFCLRARDSNTLRSHLLPAHYTVHVQGLFLQPRMLRLLSLSKDKSKPSGVVNVP